MFKGYLIKLINNDNNRSNVTFAHKLYGRIISQYYRGNAKRYYKRGMLHNTLFTRIGKGRIIVEDIASIDFDELQKYCGIKVLGEVEIDEKNYTIKTGKQFWVDKYEEKGEKVHVSKENK